MKAKEIMNKGNLRFCGRDASLQEAVKIMKDANCGVLPVVDTGKTLIGIITDRDIAMSLALPGPKDHARLFVGDVMSTDVKSVLDTDDISVALKKMRIHQIGRIPVVDQAGKLKGILTLHSLLHHSLTVKSVTADASAREENVFKTLKAVTGRYARSKKAAGNA